MSSFEKLSSRVSSFAESATLALAARAKKMIASGQDVINFSVGEPDFNTASGVIEAAYEAAKKGETKYTAVAGTPDLRQAVLDRIQADYSLSYGLEEVMACNGGKQAIFHFLQAVLEPGDEVMIPSPYWTSFPEMVKLAEGKPVIVPNRSARPDLDFIQKSINSKTRAFILNSPANPSGMTWTKQELQGLAEILKPHGTWLLSDDTYYQLVYEPAEFHSLLQLDPDFKERTCLVGSTSKSYAMTGWRLGWALGPKHLIQAMAKIQGQVTSSPSSVSQAGAIAALRGCHSESVKFKEMFEKRRSKLQSLLQSYQLEHYPLEGAFYAFIELQSKLPEGRPVASFCEELLEKQGVCLVPGEAFGEPAYVRLSYALSEAQIEDGLARVMKALKS